MILRYLSLFLLLCMTSARQANRKRFILYRKVSEGNNELADSAKPCKIGKEEVEEAFKDCLNLVNETRNLEAKLVELGRVVKKTQRITDPSLQRMRDTDEEVKKCEYGQMDFEFAMVDIFQKFQPTQEDVRNVLPNVELDGQFSSEARQRCIETLPEINCDRNSQYRTLSGQCNNLENPTWGSTMECHQRLMPAYYEGQSGFRRSYLGGPLPPPRYLSQNVHYHLNQPTNFVTHMYMFFGQLLDHDITLTPSSTTLDNEAIQCCPPSNTTHPQCAPILIPIDDPFYSQFNITCNNFVRSAICPTCRLGLRAQMNQITAFIDGSFVYGVTENESMALRANDGTGRLRVQTSNNGDLLPPSPDPQNDQCSFPDTGEICFVAGDSRVNQHNTLTSLHTIFMREHNRIATELRVHNPDWDENTLFEEARRIVGAEMQSITYREYLPITLGRDRMDYFRLWLSNRGQTTYNPRTNPTIYNEFTTAAFRFGHSLVNSMVSQSRFNPNGEERLLRNEFFQPFSLYNGIIDPLLRGVVQSPAQWFDRHVSPDVTNFLYRVRGNNTGLDLASINIQRGRDHGMPPYVDMVRYCSEGNIIVRSFPDLVNMMLMPASNVRVLQSNYRHVRDIDLWTGILSEIPNDGAVVGPTAACIIGIQFHNLKFGDRFYFEHRGQLGSFTYPQIQEIRRVSLSKIICLNSEISQMPLNAMIFPSQSNPMIRCRNVLGPDLSLWRS